MMMHIKGFGGNTVAINTQQIVMVYEGTDGCHITFVGGSHIPCSENYLELIARINTAINMFAT